jgi:hypothetical protein
MLRLEMRARDQCSGPIPRTLTKFPDRGHPNQRMVLDIKGRSRRLAIYRLALSLHISPKFLRLLRS